MRTEKQIQAVERFRNNPTSSTAHAITAMGDEAPAIMYRLAKLYIAAQARRQQFSHSKRISRRISCEIAELELAIMQPWRYDA